MASASQTFAYQIHNGATNACMEECMVHSVYGTSSEHSSFGVGVYFFHITDLHMPFLFKLYAFSMKFHVNCISFDFHIPLYFLCCTL